MHAQQRLPNLASLTPSSSLASAQGLKTQNRAALLHCWRCKPK